MNYKKSQTILNYSQEDDQDEEETSFYSIPQNNSMTAFHLKGLSQPNRYSNKLRVKSKEKPFSKVEKKLIKRKRCKVCNVRFSFRKQ